MREYRTALSACDTAQAQEPALSNKEQRGKHNKFILVALVLLLLALLWTSPASPAKYMDEAFRLSYSHTLQTPSPDPLAFIADLEPVMPKPVTVLTIADAVAYELIRRSRTLNETDALRTATVIVHESLELGYDPLLVLAVIYVESYFDNYAISPVGAEGLMQIMPATGQWLAEQMGLGYTLAHTFDPTRNVRLGIRYLVRLENQFKGNTAFALTAYNRGPSATKYILRHHNGRLPKNIRDAYASKVLLRYRALRVLYGSLPIT